MNPFSVVVCTYNSDWDKTRRTLYSILSQKDIDVQIVIADDGSSVNNFDKIRSYFLSLNFTNYRLVENIQNQGTVKNILSAIPFCTGEFVKGISPGDLFYNDSSLRNAYDFMCVNSDVSIFFGGACWYNNDAGSPVLLKRHAPRIVKPYKKKQFEKNRKRYLLCTDFILGASLIYKTDILRRYLNEISPFVKYAEDLLLFPAFAKSEKIILISSMDYLLWYEHGHGISTSNSQKWHDILVTEKKACYQYLEKQGFISKKIYDFVYCSPTFKRILFLLVNPDMYIYYWLWRFHIEDGWYRNKRAEICFLNRWLRS